MPKPNSPEEARVSPTRFKNPQIIEMKPRKMAVVVTKGDPNVVAAKVLPALYGSVYKLKFQLKSQGADFKVGALCARWPDAHLVPKDQWTGIWGLQVPDDMTELPQKTPEIQVKLETWTWKSRADPAPWTLLRGRTYCREAAPVHSERGLPDSGFT